MKLSKSKLINAVTPELEKCGYTMFKDTLGQGLWCKKVRNGLYLTLGGVIHRFYDNAFTGDFYLSKTTRWASMWGDIPRLCYKRIGDILTDEEMKRYNALIDEEPAGWWVYKDKSSACDFAEAVKEAERRFINQPDLIEQIEHSIEVKTLYDCAQSVIKNMESDIIDGDYEYIPAKQVDDIPLDWFKAAEWVLKETQCPLNVNTVKLLAADAYRQKVLNEI